jgi:hypothetical protein
LERHPDIQGDGLGPEIKREIASWVDMFKPAVIRRTHIGIGLMFFQQFVGINAVGDRFTSSCRVTQPKLTDEFVLTAHLLQPHALRNPGSFLRHATYNVWRHEHYSTTGDASRHAGS